MPWWWRSGVKLLLHSDRGSQYTSEQFQKLTADQGVICSMSRSGDVWDNAAMKSFFSSLKTERAARKTCRTRDDAGAARGAAMLWNLRKVTVWPFVSGYQKWAFSALKSLPKGGLRLFGENRYVPRKAKGASARPPKIFNLGASAGSFVNRNQSSKLINVEGDTTASRYRV
jgi:transposase InsO family protein